MKNIKYLLLLLIVSCTSPKIVYDYDTKEDFAKYKTFNFFSDAGAGEGLNNFDNKRIKTSIQKELIKQGLRLDTLPDFYINFSAKQHQEERRNTVGVGINSGGGNIGFGISGGIPIGAKRINQKLTIDFVTEKEDQLFWQSISESLLKENQKPDKRTAHYQKLTIKMLSKFPPNKNN